MVITGRIALRLNFEVCFALLDIRYKCKREEKALEKKFIRPSLFFGESFLSKEVK